MARAFFKHVCIDPDRLKVIQNCAVYLFAVGTGTLANPPTGTAITGSMYAARTGGAPIANPLVSNSQGEVEAWLDTPQMVDVVVTDNGDAAFYPGGALIQFGTFKEVGHAYHDPADITLGGGGGGVTDHGALTGLADDDHPQYETSAEAAAKVTAHEAAGDPHPTYETSAEAAAKVTAHAAAGDPHPTYETSAEAQAKVDAHTGDAVDAHDASAVSFAPAGTISATDVQAAIVEAAAEAGAGHAEDHDHDGAPTQKLAAANTHESPAADTHHAKVHSGPEHTDPGTPTQIDFGDAASVGTANNPPAADDHQHGLPAVTFSLGGTIIDPAGARIFMVRRLPFACTVTNVRGHRKGGTGATINARRNQASDHLSSDLSLTSADSWTDGGAVQNTAYAAGDDLEIEIASIAGVVTEIAIQVDFTRP